MNTDDLMTIPEASSVLLVTRQAIYNAIRRGELDTVNVLGRRYLRRDQVANYVPKPPHRPRKQAASE